MIRRTLYIFLVALLALAGTIQVRRSMDVIQLLAGGEGLARSPVLLRPFSNVIAEASPEARLADVQKGDRLLAVNGRLYTGESVLSRAVATAHAGDSLTLRVLVQPEDQERTGTVILAPAAGASAGTLWSKLLLIDLALFTPVLCVLLGFWVAFLRPRDFQAWILLGMMLAFANLSSFDMTGWEDGLRVGSIAFTALARSLWPAWMLLFGVYFPEQLQFERRRPWLKWLLLAPLFAAAVGNVLEAVGRSENLELARAVGRVMAPLQTPLGFISFAAIGCFFAFLGTKVGTIAQPDARRRLKLLMYGAEISLGPSGLLFLANLVRGQSGLMSSSEWLVLPAIILLCLFPVTMAYVIVVHRAMDARMAIRQGVQYALAKGGVRALQAILSAAVILFASYASSSVMNTPQRITVMALGVSLVVWMSRAAEWLRSWIDRRFFREAVSAEQVLSELSENVRGIVEAPKLMETVARRISESLHVERVALLLESGSSGFCPAYALGGAPQGECFPENGDVAGHLRGGAPAYVYLEDKESWVHQVHQEERGRLEQLSTQLLVPIRSRDQMLGFLSLGPRQAEAPYTRSDVRLLSSVAAQTGLALENSRLTAAIAQEVAHSARLNREVEIAREVQERLFPQELPPVEGLDYYGACRPALGVGGDYYDFLALGGGNLGIAVGDVSGKGIAAALLMATLQAALRGRTMTGEQDLGSIIRHVNRVVYNSSAANRYATFFYAQYEPARRRLVYVNAGHNPPVILRGEEVLRLEASGTVVGLLPDFEYEQGTVTLQPGDVFIAYTDGISEAMSVDHEEWSEEAMIAVARDCKGMNARQILERLVSAADAFAAGAPQHDDMTVVVGRVL